MKGTLPHEGKNYFFFLIKVLFIYSKIEEGWTVTKLEDNSHPERLGKFEFKRVLPNGNSETMVLQ